MPLAYYFGIYIYDSILSVDQHVGSQCVNMSVSQQICQSVSLSVDNMLFSMSVVSLSVSTLVSLSVNTLISQSVNISLVSQLFNRIHLYFHMHFYQPIGIYVCCIDCSYQLQPMYPIHSQYRKACVQEATVVQETISLQRTEYIDYYICQLIIAFIHYELSQLLMSDICIRSLVIINRDYYYYITYYYISLLLCIYVWSLLATKAGTTRVLLQTEQHSTIQLLYLHVLHTHVVTRCIMVDCIAHIHPITISACIAYTRDYKMYHGQTVQYTSTQLLYMHVLHTHVITTLSLPRYIQQHMQMALVLHIHQRTSSVHSGDQYVCITNAILMSWSDMLVMC